MQSPWGLRIDEYYWLRDDARRDPDVLAYLAAENAYSDEVLAPLRGLEDSLFEELVGRLQPDESSVPVRYRGDWYYTRFEPGREYPVHARRRGTLEAAEEVLLDCNELARGLEYLSLGEWRASPDGRLLAYTVDTVGRRQYELRVKDLTTGTDLPDRVANLEAELAWTEDGRTILYVEKDPETLLSVRLKAHVLGTSSSEDRLLYEEADDSFYLGLGKSRSERYILLSCSSTQQSQWWYIDSADPQLRLHAVLAREADHEYQVEHLGEDLVLRTNWQAPNFRIVRVPIVACGEKGAWVDVVPHRSDTFIEDFEVATGHLAVSLRREGQLRLAVLDWGGRPLHMGSDGQPQELPPSAAQALHRPAGAVTLLPTPDIDSRHVRYEYTSLATPPAIYELDVPSGHSECKKTQIVLGGFRAENYATQFRMARARDGALVPVSIAYHRDTPLDGTAPIYQQGYGAYGYSLDPDFRSSWISLMDRGFVVAIAHVRGGQELGRSWYDQGRLLCKRNSFTDFIDVTQMLVAEQFGAADKVCAQGGSAGGLLIGAVANLAPERYRALVAHVPFVDVVTTMLDESIPLTTNEFDQWGDPRQQVYYDYMLGYSPYDNVGAHHYPALLVFTGLWDSQVQYFEPAKWVARLRAHKTGDEPVLLCVDLHAGHGGKSGRFQRYREAAREYAFLLWRLGAA